MYRIGDSSSAFLQIDIYKMKIKMKFMEIKKVINTMSVLKIFLL